MARTLKQIKAAFARPLRHPDVEHYSIDKVLSQYRARVQRRLDVRTTWNHADKRLEYAQWCRDHDRVPLWEWKPTATRLPSDAR